MRTTIRRRCGTEKATTALLAMIGVVFLAGVGLAATSGGTEASALSLGPPVSQCNDTANVGATTTTCDVTITNNISYNADGTSTTASTIVTTVNGVASATTATSPVTEIHQCNRSGTGGASTVTCTSTITNNVTGAPASGSASSTIDQCNPVHGAPTQACTATPAGPNATGGYQAIGQCNNSGDTGTVTCTASTAAATDSAPTATVDQCNASGTTGASTVTCTATLTNTFTCVGTTTTLANGACFLPTTTTRAPTSTTTGATTPTTTGSTVPGDGVTSGPTTTSVTSSANPSQPGQAVMFTATVGGGVSTGTGSVTFFDGSTMLGTGQLVGGRATFTTSGLSIGDHSITAQFSGTGGGAGGGTSTSAAIRQTVGTGGGSPGTSSGLPRTGGRSSVVLVALALLLLVAGAHLQGWHRTRPLRRPHPPS